jgi:four helix bundle protein
MFDYEKLIAYQKAKAVNRKIQNFVSKKKINPILQDQLYRALTSILLNIAEGTGKLSKQDRKNYYVISRGSVFECASILEIINDEGIITFQDLSIMKSELEEVSRLLSGLIKKLTNCRAM